METLQSTPQLNRASETLITTSVQSQSGLTRADVTIISSTLSAVRAVTMLEWTGYHQVMFMCQDSCLQQLILIWLYDYNYGYNIIYGYKAINRDIRLYTDKRLYMEIGCP